MCGIIYGKGNNGVRISKKIMKLYDKQRSRGSEGFGYVASKNGVIQEHVLKEKEADIRHMIKDSDANEILYHHRLPTSTANLYEAAHPIEVENDSLKYRYYVAHNGVITNSKELYETHNKLGFTYSTELRKETRIVTRDRAIHDSVEIKFNDSESLAIELARYVEGLSKEIGTRGSVAFIMLQVDRETAKTVKVFFGRNTGNPLYIEKNNHLFILKSSSENGIEVEVNKVFAFEDDKITEFAKVDIGYHYKYEPTYVPNNWNNNSGYKNTSAGFTAPQLPMKVDMQEKARTLSWVEDEEREKVIASLRSTVHVLPGDTETSAKYEAKLEQLQSEKDELEAEQAENTKALRDISNVRDGSDKYWELIGIADELRTRIKEIEDEIDGIYEMFYSEY